MTIIYVVIIALVIFYSFRYDGMEEYDMHKEHRFWLVCFLLTCVTGFSYGLGGDKFMYMSEFEQYSYSLSELPEMTYYNILFKGQMPLWTLVNFFAKHVFDSFYVVQLLEAAFINGAAFYVCRRYTSRYFMFVILYCFTFTYFMLNTDIMREGFSLSLALLGVEAYFRKRRVVSLLCLVGAVLFHISAITMLLFPLVRFTIKKKTIVIAFCVSFFLWALSDFVLVKAVGSLPGGVGILVKKILVYSSQASNFFGFMRSALTYLICPYIIMYYSIKMDDNEERRRCKEKLLSFQLVLAVLGTALTGFTRILNYAQFYYLYMFADFIYMLFRMRQHFVVRCGTALIGYGLMVLPYIIVSWPITKLHYFELWFPYTCILDEEKWVFIRGEAHKEALVIEKTDQNTRDVE
jgi:hypothetical protein